jgi:hypothetical protein
MYGGYPGAEPAEVSSLKSMLRIGGILALVIGILSLLGGLVALAGAIFVASVTGYGGFYVTPVFAIIAFVFELIIYLQLKEIRRMVDAGQYQAAKDKTLIWMILGFIFGWIIVGIVVLIAWMKFDPVINWQRQMQSGGQPGAPAWSAQPPAAPPMAPMAATSPAPGAPAAGMCPKCGKPATWVAQYNRWYCYTDQQYV